MIYKALLLFVLLGVASFSFSQGKPASAGKPELTETQKLGRLLVQQRCSICHLTALNYGPPLSKQTGAGKPADYVEKTILDGGLKMPAFKYGLEASEVAAIIDYLKTVEPVATRPAGETAVNPE
jgi:mono/diheme cytochrome c family protein